MIIGISDWSLYGNQKEEIYCPQYLNTLCDFLTCSKVDGLILREKTVSRSDYQKLLNGLVERLPSWAFNKLIIHSYIGIARDYGIGQLHLPGHLIHSILDDPNTYKGLRLSCSLHENDFINPSFNLDTLLKRVSFFTMSPVRPTTCKPGSEPIKESHLADLHEHHGSQMVLLGGIDADNIDDYRKKGYTNFAIRSGLKDLIYFSK